jgi:uncharacterized protein (TIGR02145 family)
MIKKFSLIAFLIILSLGLYSQRSILELIFTAVDRDTHVQLDSIKVINRTQGGETMVYWPDTTLSIEISPGDLLLYVGYATFSTVSLQEVGDEVSLFDVHQNFPNPIGSQSEISMYIPQEGKVSVMITDLQGEIVLRNERQLNGGYHSFRFFPGGCHLYFLTVNWNGINSSIKMISAGQNDRQACRLDYVRSNSGKAVLKASLHVNDIIVRQSGILDAPQERTAYTFKFATNIPCLETPTVEYAGMVYNTIQIFSQCWLKENLNVGTMIPGDQNMTENGTIEKYCFNNEPDSCIKYGGLYQWGEVMQYTVPEDPQDICPPGWHIPTDEDWKVLEGSVDSHYGIGDPEWDIFQNSRGFDAGTNLKTTGWYGNVYGINLFGFSGLPGGYRLNYDNFDGVGQSGDWWTSTAIDMLWATYRDLSSNIPEITRSALQKNYALSVRCLRDNLAF